MVMGTLYPTCGDHGGMVLWQGGWLIGVPPTPSSRCSRSVRLMCARTRKLPARRGVVAFTEAAERLVGVTNQSVPATPSPGALKTTTPRNPLN